MIFIMLSTILFLSTIIVCICINNICCFHDKVENFIFEFSSMRKMMVQNLKV